MGGSINGEPEAPGVAQRRPWPERVSPLASSFLLTRSWPVCSGLTSLPLLSFCNAPSGPLPGAACRHLHFGGRAGCQGLGQCRAEGASNIRSVEMGKRRHRVEPSQERFLHFQVVEKEDIKRSTVFGATEMTRNPVLSAHGGGLMGTRPRPLVGCPWLFCAAVAEESGDRDPVACKSRQCPPAGLSSTNSPFPPERAAPSPPPFVWSSVARWAARCARLFSSPVDTPFPSSAHG